MQVISILKQIRRKILRIPPVPITLYPKTKQPVGRVLVSYLTAGILEPDNSDVFNGHSNLWESREIAKNFCNRGYIVDVIDYGNNSFIPQKKYNIVFDVYINLQRLAPYLDKNTIKIIHLTGSYPEFQNQAELNRVVEFEKRTGKKYTPKRFVQHVNQAKESIEIADHCTLLGNTVTLSTYPKKYHGKITLLPVTTSLTISSIISFTCKKNPTNTCKGFLWFFGAGAVHKGLDRLIEIFHAHPDLTLHIVGDVTQEQDFMNAYEKKLQSKNIFLHGPLSINSKEFEKILKNVFSFIAPSCSEGISPATATCLQLGLFPIISRNTGITLPKNCGIYLETCDIEEIRKAIFMACNMDNEELKKQITTCQKYALSLFSRKNFTKKINGFLQKKIPQRKNIAIFCNLSWGGGADIIRQFISALNEIKSHIKIYLLFPEPVMSPKTKIKNFLKKKVNSNLSSKQLLDYFSDINLLNITIVKYKNKRNYLSRVLFQHNIDVLLPFLSPPQEKLHIPWIGYIFDYQHKYFPELFSKEIIASRNKYFSLLVQNAPAVIVTSKSAKNDAIKFNPSQFHEKIFTLPFSAIPQKQWLDMEHTKTYSISSPYFIISNQFWVHKSHITAFKALKILLKTYNKSDVHIVCTGVIHDHRDPNYFGKLTKEIKKLEIDDKIHILGHIPKKEQIDLLKNSIALIQPTLFEGGPGGGSTSNAISLGVPVLISDIAVNKEVHGSNVIFFKTKDDNDLAKKMEYILTNRPVRPSKQMLEEKSQRAHKNLANALLQAINFAMENKNAS
jgi:glycosyltransferase involved in cell wall biosynthesis